MLARTGEALDSDTAAAIKAVYHAAWSVTTTTATTTAATTATAANDETEVIVETATSDTASQQQQQQKQQQLDWQSLLVAMSAVGESPLSFGFSEGLHRAAVAVGATVGVLDVVKLPSELQLLVLGAESASASAGSTSVSALHAQAVQHKLHTLLPSAVTLGVGGL
jgi:hypothetical protein